MSGERPRTHGEHGERLADWRPQTPEDERQPPRHKLDPDDPRVAQLGRVAINEPQRAPLDAERARKLGELPTRESVEYDREPPPEREAPPEQRDRDDTPTRPDRER